MSDHRLEQAAVAVHQATDARGLKIFLCRDPLDITNVRHATYMMAQWIRPETQWLEPNGEEATMRNIALLANLLAEHLRERRENNVSDPG